MSLYRRNAKRDQAEPSIIDALLKAGADEVKQLSLEDWPDLLVLFHGQMYLGEVKTGRRKLSDGQGATITRLQARGYRVSVWRTPEDALQAIGACH